MAPNPSPGEAPRDHGRTISFVENPAGEVLDDHQGGFGRRLIQAAALLGVTLKEASARAADFIVSARQADPNDAEVVIVDVETGAVNTAAMPNGNGLHTTDAETLSDGSIAMATYPHYSGTAALLHVTDPSGNPSVGAAPYMAWNLDLGNGMVSTASYDSGGADMFDESLVALEHFSSIGPSAGGFIPDVGDDYGFTFYETGEWDLIRLSTDTVESSGWVSDTVQDEVWPQSMALNEMGDRAFVVTDNFEGNGARLGIVEIDTGNLSTTNTEVPLQDSYGNDISGRAIDFIESTGEVWALGGGGVTQGTMLIFDQSGNLLDEIQLPDYPVNYGATALSPDGTTLWINLIGVAHEYDVVSHTATGRTVDLDGAMGPITVTDDGDVQCTDNDGDGVCQEDGDCDDNDPANTDTPTPHYPDNDGDGHGAMAILPENQCPGTPGWAEISDDCDDDDPLYFANTFWWQDVDLDGYGGTSSNWQCGPGDGFVLDFDGDCLDDEPDVNPGMDEVPCDGFDNDCSGGSMQGGYAPEELEDPYCQDNDGDGYTPHEGDPDDDDPNTYPDAPEIDDGVDNNNNNRVDECLFGDDEDGNDWGEGAECEGIDIEDGDEIDAVAEDGIGFDVNQDGDKKVVEALGDGEVDLDLDKESPPEIEVFLDLGAGLGAAVHNTKVRVHRATDGETTIEVLDEDDDEEHCIDLHAQGEVIEDAICEDEQAVADAESGEVDEEQTDAEGVLEFLEEMGDDDDSAGDDDIEDDDDNDTTETVPPNCADGCSFLGYPEGPEGVGKLQVSSLVLPAIMVAMVLRRSRILNR